MMERFPVSLDMLRRDELLYELSLRGFADAASLDVPTLLLRLREVADQSLVCPDTVDHVSELQLLHLKITELGEIIAEITQDKEISRARYRRVLHRVHHLFNRIADVRSLQLDSSVKSKYHLYAQVADFRQLLNNISVTRTDHRVRLNEMLSGGDLINFGRDKESGVDQQNIQSTNLIHNNTLPAVASNVSDSIQRGPVPAYPVVFPSSSNSGNLSNTSLVFKTIEVVHRLSRIVKDVGLLTSDNVSDVLKLLEILVNLVYKAAYSQFRNKMS